MEELIAEVADMTARKDHTSALIEIAFHLKLGKLLSELMEIEGEQEKAGYLTEEINHRRRELSSALMTEMEKALTPDNFTALKSAL